jgi:hypothetical protein
MLYNFKFIFTKNKFLIFKMKSLKNLRISTMQKIHNLFITAIQKKTI